MHREINQLMSQKSIIEGKEFTLKFIVLLRYWLENFLIAGQEDMMLAKDVKFMALRMFPLEYMHLACLQLKTYELRLILLYIDPVLFKKILGIQMYKHYCLLHTAFRIFYSPHILLNYILIKPENI
ncbi:hypothetical protein ALC53_01951 [Atta colombica]|uniref:Uncharacterized protein n=1 Tax=Atta colombica TaxID=520822 RepID=A0A195BT84_9HYME|nr:hypothetical protein ALC53_01951 [Atta colombica]